MNNNVKNFVALDTETTGLFQEDKIIEISLAKYQNDKLVAKYDQYINPEGRRNDAESINHITPDMLENQPVLTDIETNIREFISDLPIIGHNISFDLRFMQNNGIDISTYKDKKIDTLALARRRRKTNNKLDQLEAEFNIVNSQQHNGLQDAIATAEVYKKIRDLYPETLSTEYISSEAENNLLGGAMYVITGKVDYGDNRADARHFIEKNGGLTQNNVTKNTDYLILGEQKEKNYMSGKHKKALQYKVNIITWNDLFD